MTDSSPSQNQPANETPLQGWKEIAAYLERDVRTAQRWEEGVGLPVRRHGGSSGSVYAYPSEIEQWRTSQPTKPTAQAQPPTERLSGRRFVPALVIGIAAVAALAIIRFGPILNPPTPRAEAAENGVGTEVVWDQAEGISPQGSISSDGKLLTYVDWHDEGNLAIRNLGRARTAGSPMMPTAIPSFSARSPMPANRVSPPMENRRPTRGPLVWT